ncbi:hypothetical protein, partial [Pseudomonas carnis]|uniref:hypothetical protein n=1 Tax=Pseudomonas carnis TaxID=2487355 RepID=UPI001E58E6BB
VEIYFFDFGIGSHHGGWAPERNREHSIRDQLSALNVGFVERLPFCQLSIPEYEGTNSASFKGETGDRVIWKFKAGEGLSFLFDRLLGKSRNI